MSSRIIYKGHDIFRSRDYRKPVRVQVPVDRDGTPVSSQPIAPDSPASPFRQGVPYRDKDDGLVYRIVDKINVAEGWGTAAFWIARYSCTWKELIIFVEKGWLDAAIEAGSPTKRYRCRDEQKILGWMSERRANSKLPSKKPSRKARPGRGS